MKDYKKILEGVVNIINTTEKSDIGFVNICTYISENFPELKESEDERIRKILIEAVKRDMVVGGTKDKKLAIAWLEKQKEFVSADFDDVWETADCDELTAPLEKYSKDAIKEMCRAWYDKGIELERRNWLEKREHSVSPLFTFEDVLTIQCAMAYAKFQDRELDVALKKLHDKVYDAYHDSKNHHIESQDGLKDEQKPYGKREECYDCQMNYGGTCKGSCAMKRGEQKPCMIQWKGNNLKEVVEFTGKNPNFDKWFKSQKEYEDYVRSHNNIFKLFNEDESHCEIPVGAWIIKTPDGYNVASKFKFVPKPVEWSEEDQAHLESIDESLFMFESGRHENVVAGIEDDRNWLKSLKGRMQPKQEWSVKDEQAIKRIDSILGQAADSHAFLSKCRIIGDKECIELQDFLKSLRLRKQWKPSEEQMEALEHFIRSIAESGFASPYDSNTKLVYSLLNDLKKLRL